MGYVIAAYALVLASLALYTLHLGRARRALRKSLSAARIIVMSAIGPGDDQLAREAGAASPLEVRAQAMYSGGGGEFTTLRLLLVRPGNTPRSVLNLPWKTDLMIRACFSDKDEAARAGACHDEYQFDGQLTVLKPMTSRFPTLAYLASAQSYPKGASRNVDSSTLPPLKKSDLVWVSDRACSYRRTFRFDPASQRYKPHAPLPACDQYSSR